MNDSYSLEDTFSWFVPDKMGRHDPKFGARYSHIWISNPNNANANGTYSFRSRPARSMPPTRERIRSGFSIRVPGPLDYELIAHVWRDVRAGQVAAEATASL